MGSALEAPHTAVAEAVGRALAEDLTPLGDLTSMLLPDDLQATASFVVTIRPALAATAASALNCQISVPDPARASHYVAADGTLVAPDTPGAFPPAPRPLTGNEVKAMLNGGAAPESRAILVAMERWRWLPDDLGRPGADGDLHRSLRADPGRPRPRLRHEHGDRVGDLAHRGDRDVPWSTMVRG